MFTYLQSLTRHMSLILTHTAVIPILSQGTIVVHPQQCQELQICAQIQIFISMKRIKTVCHTHEFIINVKGEGHINQKYLYSFKVIGINGPQGTKKLYGKRRKYTQLTTQLTSRPKSKSMVQLTMWMMVKSPCRHSKFNMNIFKVILASTGILGNGVQSLSI